MEKLYIWVEPVPEAHFVLGFKKSDDLEGTYYHRPIEASKRLCRLVDRFNKSGYSIRPFGGSSFGLVIEKKSV